MQVHRNVPPVTSAQNSAAVRSFGLVTQVGANWNQLIGELNGWLLFGRALEAQ